MMNGDEARKRLGDAADRRANAKAEWQGATDDLARWIVVARDAGVPITEVARLSGISRQAVYDVLRGKAPGTS